MLRFLAGMIGGAAYFWKRNPFFRLLVPLTAGIVMQWNCQWMPTAWWTLMIISITGILVFFWLRLFDRFRFSWATGVVINCLFISAGGLLAWHRDIRNDANWIGHNYSDSSIVVAVVDEPLVAKAKSSKANASVRMIFRDGKPQASAGNIIVYFKKDSALRSIGFGTRIIFRKPLQLIRNSGNPGGFDYKRYCLFQGITHQVYLQPGEFSTIGEKETDLYQQLFLTAREKVLSILRNNITGERELGLAEALLVGYKNDLDKSLVQSYSNTGVVHVIAISGLHLGLIYTLLIWILRPLAKTRYGRWLQAVLIIAGLWGFSILAGGQPSVLRSAVMFSCLVAGKQFLRHSSIYNSLSLSAFFLLCYNPYWLWDAGFQLSYSAVLSIVVFMKPIYYWFYFKNKLLDLIWKMNAVTLAAQILTTPISVYHFHQFPLSFALSNLLAVPLSSLILLLEIMLCLISPMPGPATLLGQVTGWLILLMNNCIEMIARLPHALWEGLQLDVAQVILLMIVIAGLGSWLMEKIRGGLLLSLISLLAFLSLRSFSFTMAERQRKVIIYNVPGHRAIDVIDGRRVFYAGDSSLLRDEFALNFHLRPSRILHRVPIQGSSCSIAAGVSYLEIGRKRIFLVDSSIRFQKASGRVKVDLLVVSRRPRLYFPDLIRSLSIDKVVFDGSVPFGRLQRWKRDCDSLGIPYHDVTQSGAFELELR